MCEPATIALAVSAIGAAGSLYQQSQQADAQTDYQNNLMIQRDQQIAVNNQLAAQQAANEQAQINQQVSEKEVQTSQDLTENSIKAAEARASAAVASGEAGVAGISIDNLLGDFARKEAVYKDSVRQNQEGFARNAQDRKDASEATRRGRVASVTPYVPKPVAGPDWAGEIAGVASAGVKYSTAPGGKNKWRWE